MRPAITSRLIGSAALALALFVGATSAQFIDVAAGESHSLALRADGTVQSWGSQCAVPELPPGVTYVEISASGSQAGGDWPVSLARRSDGSVVAWGEGASAFGMVDVPALPPGLTYVAIDAGPFHAVALRSDGSVVAWGDHAGTVPPLPPGLTYVQVSAGGWVYAYSDSCSPQPFTTWDDYGHSAALRSDGSIVQWGAHYGEVPPPPPGLTYVEVSAGSHHVAARLSDGSVVVASTSNWFNVTNVPSLPPGVTFERIEAGGGLTVARLSDGSTVAWGTDISSATTVPALPPGVTDVDFAVGSHSTWGISWQLDWWTGECISWGNVSATPHTVALRSDGTLASWGYNSSGCTDVPSYSGVWTDLCGSSNDLSLPRLELSGPLTPASTVTLDLYSGASQQLALVFLSFTSTPTPFLGGTLHAFPFDELVVTSTDVLGEIHGSAFFPGATSGQGLWFQVAVADPSVPFYGASLSNGVKGTVP